MTTSTIVKVPVGFLRDYLIGSCRGLCTADNAAGFRKDFRDRGEEPKSCAIFVASIPISDAPLKDGKMTANAKASVAEHELFGDRFVVGWQRLEGYSLRICQAFAFQKMGTNFLLHVMLSLAKRVSTNQTTSSFILKRASTIAYEPSILVIGTKVTHFV